MYYLLRTKRRVAIELHAFYLDYIIRSLLNLLEVSVLYVV